MPSVFISYRRDDTQDFATLLRTQIAHVLGRRWKIFQDTQSIQPGANFRDVIADVLQQCDVVLVVIGDRWSHARLSNEDDIVRAEIAMAVERGIRIIPILVEGASMPEADALPDSLKPISSIQGLGVRRDYLFEDDARRIASELRRVVTADKAKKGGLAGRLRSLLWTILLPLGIGALAIWGIARSHGNKGSSREAELVRSSGAGPSGVQPTTLKLKLDLSPELVRLLAPMDWNATTKVLLVEVSKKGGGALATEVGSRILFDSEYVGGNFPFDNPPPGISLEFPTDVALTRDSSGVALSSLDDLTIEVSYAVYDEHVRRSVLARDRLDVRANVGETKVVLGQVVTDWIADGDWRSIGPAKDSQAVSSPEQARKDCTGGLAHACTRLAWGHFTGQNGLAQDENRFRLLMERGCDLADDEACEAAGIQGHLDGRTQESVPRLEKGCAAGRGKACALLSDLYGGYHQLINLKSNDNKKSYEYESKACKAGVVASCRLLVRYQRNGRPDLGVAKDEVLYQRSVGALCDRGYGPACRDLANFLSNAERVGQDLEAAAELLAKSCNSGDVASCGDLAERYREGKGVPRDEARALTLSKDACLGGHNFACGQWARGLESGASVVRYRALSLGAAWSDWFSRGRLAFLHYQGSGVQKDEKLAARIAASACGGYGGNTVACGILGASFCSQNTRHEKERGAKIIADRACGGPPRTVTTKANEDTSSWKFIDEVCGTVLAKCEAAGGKSAP